MKNHKIAILAIISIFCLKQTTYCMQAQAIALNKLETKPHETKPTIKGFNTGAISSMEAGSYWAARAMLVENCHQEEDMQETTDSSCGLFTLLYAIENLLPFKANE